MTFVDKIHQLGWLNPGFSEDSEGALVLQCCILRYYGLVESSDLSFSDLTREGSLL